MAKYEDITIDQGTDVSIQLNLVNADGSAKNLTGYTAASSIKPNYTASDSDTIDFAVLVSDPQTSGILTMSLTNIQTDAMEHGRYFYDVEIYHTDSDSNGVVERILEGQVKVTPSITR